MRRPASSLLAGMLLAASVAGATPHEVGKHGTSREVPPPPPAVAGQPARPTMPDVVARFQKEEAKVEKDLAQVRDRIAKAGNDKHKKALSRREKALQRRLDRLRKRLTVALQSAQPPAEAPAGANGK